MTMQRFNGNHFRATTRTLLAVMLAGALAPELLAQGYGAVQAVRQRVSGLQAGPGEAPPTDGTTAPTPTTSEASPDGRLGYPGTAATLDTKFVSPTALGLAVIRPAQIIAAPVVQLLPTEVAAAASREYLGIDLAEIDEVAAFIEFSNPTKPLFGLTYGLTFKFKSPFRASSIPERVRPAVQLADLNDKKYWQSAHPFWPSFYGPNNKTLVVAPDEMLRKVVASTDQPKSGRLLERAQQATAGNDLYVAIDGERARGIVPIVLGLANVKIPDEAKPLLESTTAAELTLNLVSRGPITLVVHCNDEAAAQQLQSLVAAIQQGHLSPAAPEAAAAEQPALEAPPAEMPSGVELYAQEMTQFRERMMQRFQPQLNGASVTLLNITADDPLQQQLFGLVVGAAAGAAAAKTGPAMNMPQPAKDNQDADTSAETGPGAATPTPPAADGAPPETDATSR